MTGGGDGIPVAAPTTPPSHRSPDRDPVGAASPAAGWDVATSAAGRQAGRPDLALPVDPAARPRTAWLVLAVDGPALELEAHAALETVRILSDPRRFRDLVLAERPRIVVCAEPPAGPAELELVSRERGRRASLRVVHLAPPEAVEARLRALRLGFDDALSATMPVVELAGRLAWLASRAKVRGANARVISITDELELDLVAHELRREGRAVHLRPKEYGLLALLAAHPGRAYTRRQLLDRVWGHEHDGSSRTVDVHVRWLRSKIEADPDRPVTLVTVRGVGYRLDLPSR